MIDGVEHRAWSELHRHRRPASAKRDRRAITLVVLAFPHSGTDLRGPFRRDGDRRQWRVATETLRSELVGARTADLSTALARRNAEQPCTRRDRVDRPVSVAILDAA